MRLQHLLEMSDQSGFDRWFQGSRVVYGGTRPMMVYHGTASVFDRFNPVAEGIDGIFFSSSKAIAQEYADWRSFDSGRPPMVYSAYLSIKKPLVINTIRTFNADVFQELVDTAKNRGNDGVIIRNVEDGYKSTGIRATTFIVFDPDQVWMLNSHGGQKHVTERYTPNNRYLLQYMQDEEVDPYSVWNRFSEFVENILDEDFGTWLENNVAEEHHEDYLEDPENFYELPEQIQQKFLEWAKKEVIPDMTYREPTEAPTWAHMSLSEPKLLNRQTWLVHFSDHADDIAVEGFRYGIDSMDRLGLTTWFGDAAKKYGGYNFAFEAGSRDADWAAGREKYGKNAVVFQNSGVKAYHHGDTESQIMFWGADVDPRDLVLLEKHGGSWFVMPHPRKQRRYQGQESREGGVFHGEFKQCVVWVQQNIQQYRRVIQGW